MADALSPEGAKRFATMAAVFVLAGSMVGCAAKVRQDVFDETIADLRTEMADLDGRVADNADRIAANEAALDMLREDLEALSVEFGEIEAQIAMIEDGLRFAMPIHFEFDRSEVRTIDEPKLDRFAEVTKKYYPAAIVTVEGFADPAGSAAYNKWLSGQRAENVATYLTSNAGLPEGRVKTAAYGEDRLVIPGAAGPGPEGMENRRVTFVIEMANERRPAATVASTTTEEGA
ncbi:MAG: OmpA family protein [Gemmatimonadetes bacterium]|nr:OmpA family protein [Gemmatimonadota bacterium]